jgi:hypothetical protein
LNSVQQSISDTLDKLNQLTVDKSKGDLDIRQQYADAYVTQEKKVADLRDQWQKETDQSRKDDLFRQYQDEQIILEQHKTVAIAYAKEIDAARQNANLSEFQRTLNELQQKQITAEQEYQLKKTQLEKELAIEVDKWNNIKALQDQALIESNKFLLSDEKQTLDSINREIKYYNDLAAAIARAKAAASSAPISTTTLNQQLSQVNLQLKTTTPIKGKAIGGAVTEATPYLVGERGPELFIPKISGQIIPNNQIARPQISLPKTTPHSSIDNRPAITINISGNTLLDSKAAEKIGNLIINRLQFSTKF